MIDRGAWLQWPGLLVLVLPLTSCDMPALLNSPLDFILSIFLM